MSKIEVCDICGELIMEKFSDIAYKVTKVGHAYDGYNPFRHKWSVDMCENCMRTLTHSMNELVILSHNKGSKE